MQIISILVLVCVGVALSASPTKYTNKYDNINIDTILQNDRVLNNYLKCLMEEGPCTAEGRELRKTLPDALASGCSKCNERQKQTSEKVIRHLMTKRKRDWERLTRKYDPKGEYKRRYEEFVKNNPKE
ncbi:ejaculatory bulb-specific protein 3 [Photinus pyralis]|uniref:ejaculatory bulb-specific protein 3 n=1 Tax=Photinus pyralis TaxID=7054 RepID=UPI0012671961|nr:ejaculatory bulb-specific protein 3 [Photinus pyralis]